MKELKRNKIIEFSLRSIWFDCFENILEQATKFKLRFANNIMKSRRFFPTFDGLILQH